jgi:hypothetical protein
MPRRTITQYQPLRDIDDIVIGILIVVGILIDLRRRFSPTTSAPTPSPD